MAKPYKLRVFRLDIIRLPFPRPCAYRHTTRPRLFAALVPAVYIIYVYSPAPRTLFAVRKIAAFRLHSSRQEPGARAPVIGRHRPTRCDQRVPPVRLYLQLTRRRCTHTHTMRVRVRREFADVFVLNKSTSFEKQIELGVHGDPPGLSSLHPSTT